MNNEFQIRGLEFDNFAKLFHLSTKDLKALQIKRHEVLTPFVTPCRIGLEDAAVGEEVLLLNYEHQSHATPYRASGPIFVRPGATTWQGPANSIPEALLRRLLSVRGYDDRHMMQYANVVEGKNLELEISNVFQRPDIQYIHLHNAKAGCFLCQVDRR